MFSSRPEICRGNEIMTIEKPSGLFPGLKSFLETNKEVISVW
ncbi:hypothetical protein CGBL_0120020 [Corynebacterium glutamicum]|nr:hypothetical protein CGBL_0120020 [Corynebacterium glutamicum]